MTVVKKEKIKVACESLPVAEALFGKNWDCENCAAANGWYENVADLGFGSVFWPRFCGRKANNAQRKKGEEKFAYRVKIFCAARQPVAPNACVSSILLDVIVLCGCMCVCVCSAIKDL